MWKEDGSKAGREQRNDKWRDRWKQKAVVRYNVETQLMYVVSWPKPKV